MALRLSLLILISLLSFNLGYSDTIPPHLEPYPNISEGHLDIPTKTVKNKRKRLSNDASHGKRDPLEKRDKELVRGKNYGFFTDIIWGTVIIVVIIIIVKFRNRNIDNA